MVTVLFGLRTKSPPRSISSSVVYVRPLTVSDYCPIMSAELKKRKRSPISAEWRLFPAQEPRLHSNVFIRPKSAKENGEVAKFISETENGRILVELEGGNQKLFDRKRLLQVFDSQTAPLLLLTPETIPYRNLAWSQLTGDDKVLEIGCSTGECSKIVLRRTKNWFGIDTSSEIIAKCQSLVGSEFADRTAKLDCLVSPIQTRNAIIEKLGEPTHVFIDIGGNRSWASVVKAIAWTYQSFQPQLVVVKSRELVAECKLEAGLINKETGKLEEEGWFETKLQSISTKATLPKHALGAPCSFSLADNNLICRYHNYYKDGCKKKDDGCILDHEHCHLCLEKGHVALDCPTMTATMIT